jgi:hypothetical protein
VSQTVGSGRVYESDLALLRRELAPALGALDAAAADPWALDEADEELPSLLEALDAACERARGFAPAPGLEQAHEDLRTALAIAGEETADVAETLAEAGTAAAAGLVWEWRGALFGVRLALRRLDDEARRAGVEARAARRSAPLLVLALGVVAVLGGALAGLWLVWLAGLLLVAGSAVLQDRRP